MTTRRQRAELRRLEMATQGRLSQFWRVVEATFRARLAALLAEIGDQVPTADQEWLIERYRTILIQTEAVMTAFAGDVSQALLTAQRSAALLGLEQSDALLARIYAPAKLRPIRLPVEAVNQFVGMLAGGNPLHTYLATFAADARKRVSDVLVAAVASGTNTRVLTPQIMQALGVSRTSAMVTARQAVYGAYRGASLEQYRANADVVDGWTWISALQPRRTCAVCWAMHGTEHTLDETLDSHLACRCTMAPRTKSWAKLGVRNVPERPPTPRGVDLFARLSEAQQRQVLGPGKFALYQSGQVQLPDLVVQVNDRTWGKSRRERSLREVRA